MKFNDDIRLCLRSSLKNGSVLCRVLIFCFFFNFLSGHSTSFAQAENRSRSPRKAAAGAAPNHGAGGGQIAAVQTESAMIYSDPDFDASVLTYLPQGKKVRVSKRIYGNYFRFYKVKITDGQFGYIATIDVSLENGAKDEDETRVHVKKKKKNHSKKRKKDSEEDEDRNSKKPILATRYVGALFGMTQFKESISGIDSSDNLLMYGLKLTGPDLLIDGPVMDINLAFHYGAPTYYNNLSSTPPSGFVGFIDTLLIFPIGLGENTQFYLAAGPMLVWSNFTVTTVGTQLHLSELNFGGSFAAGYAVRVGHFSVRLEGKLMQEKQQQRGLQLGIQSEF